MNMSVLRSTGAGGTGAGRATIIGGDERALREFLALHLGAMTFATGETTATIGALPADALWFALPLPADARVVGSVVRDYGGIEILLLAPIAPETAVEHYEATLISAGWAVVEDWPLPPRGFVGPQSAWMRRFCHASAGAALSVSVGAADGGSTLRLQVEREKHPCHSLLPPQAHQIEDVPVLSAPSDARLNPLGSSSGGGPGGRQFSSLAVLKTGQAVAQLAEWYEDQLREQGWQQVSAVTSAQVAASAWSRLAAETSLTATLMLAAEPLAPGEVTLALHVFERDR